MIVHQHGDGSKDYEYEVGDTVKITNVIAGNEWLRRVIGRVGTVRKVGYYNRDSLSRHTAILDVQDSPDWGASSCYPWMVEPTDGTKVSKTLADG